jgi:hypothetical protein
MSEKIERLPFYESIISLLQDPHGADVHCLMIAIQKTKISQNHDQIINALESAYKRDFPSLSRDWKLIETVSSLNEQKREAEAEAAHRRLNAPKIVQDAKATGMI